MRLDRSVFAAPRAAFALLVAAAALLTGCGTSTTVRPAEKPLSRVSISVHVDTLSVGGQVQFVATAYDTNDVATGGVAISWRSTDPAVSTVNGSGLVTATGEGATLIIASASGKSDTAFVYVKSALGGWFVQASGTASALNGITFLPNGHTGFAVGAAGTMVATTDAGAHWSPRASHTTFDLFSVWFSNATTGWAVGSAGTLVSSADGGASWTQRVNLFTSSNLKCVRFVDGSHGWIVGSGGFVARTRDAGATWTSQFLGSLTHYSVAFSDTLNGWVVGAGGIYGTHDGGTSWYLVQPSVTVQALHGVSRFSNTVAWAVGAQGSIASTAPTADSLAWSLMDAGANYQLNAIHMVTGAQGWIAGANVSAGAILVTTDAGVTWTPQVSASDVALNGIYFADGLRGWAVGAAGRIVHTSTAGAP